MEPKDLKNSQEELSGMLVVPETVDDQNITEESVDQPEVIVISEVENAVEEVAEVSVDETVESAIHVSEEVEAPEVNETETQLVEEEVVAQEVPEEIELEVAVVEEVVTSEIEETPAVVVEEEVAAETETEVIISEVEAEVVEEVLETLPEAEVVAVSAEIPSIEELIDVSEDDLEIHEDDLLDENSPKHKMADYADLDEIGLITELRALLLNDDFDRIRDDVDAIKINFFRRYRANIEAQKAAFVSAGGDIAEFKVEPDPYELDLRNLLKQYQDIRNEHNRRADESKDDNLQRKYDIIE